LEDSSAATTNKPMQNVANLMSFFFIAVF